MELDLARLRRGELIAAGSALLLVVFMFFFKWFGVGRTSVNAWHAMTIVRWLMLVTVVFAVGLAYLQASRRSPALPVSASVIVATVGAILMIVLIYRVLINEPGPNTVDQKLGAFLGLLSAIGIAYGGYESLRTEGVAAKDERTEVETVTLQGEPPPA